MNEYIDKREWQPVEERNKGLVEKLKQICKYAYEKSPRMKILFDEAGFQPSQIKTLEDMEKIPIITRDQYVKLQREDPPFGGFLTVPYDTLKRIYVHPGPQYETLSDADIEHAQKILAKVGAKKGEIVINPATSETSKKGVFAAGDITNIPYKQYIIAAGEGAKAGLSVYNYLKNK